MNLPLFCAAFASVCAIAALTVAFSARRAAHRAESLPPAPCSCALRIESLATALTETQEALSVVANRVKMQRVRNAATHTDPPEHSAPMSVSAAKDALRRRAGLVAGRPAPHQ